jgi:hypothetical protein
MSVSCLYCHKHLEDRGGGYPIEERLLIHQLLMRHRERMEHHHQPWLPKGVHQDLSFPREEAQTLKLEVIR